MTINFATARMASGSDKRAFQSMNSFMAEVATPPMDVWQSELQLEGSGKYKVSCAAHYFSGVQNFSCLVRPSHYSTEYWNIPKGSRISEVRYGDIDRDGDIDIAVKLTDGAIYVFHNLSK